MDGKLLEGIITIGKICVSLESYGIEYEINESSLGLPRIDIFETDTNGNPKETRFCDIVLLPNLATGEVCLETYGATSNGDDVEKFKIDEYEKCVEVVKECYYNGEHTVEMDFDEDFDNDDDDYDEDEDYDLDEMLDAMPWDDLED